MMLRLLLLFGFSFAVSRAAPVKLALIELSPAVGEVGALLTESLSHKTNIVLLERAALDKILRERALAGNDPANVVKAGQILGADAVVFLDTSGPKTNLAMEVRLVGVKEGAILFSLRTLARIENAERFARTLSAQLAATCAKVGADRTEVVPLTVLNLRSPTSSAASELLDRELTSLLLLRLAHETNLLVLERRKLLDVATEKEFGAATEKFWAGAYVLDGIVNRDGIQPERATVSARLVARDRSVTTIEVSGPRTNLAVVVSELARKVLATTKATRTGNWKAEKEAAELAEEAAWALRWQMYPEAQAAADSAWALGLRTRAVAANRALAYAREYNPIHVAGEVISSGGFGFPIVRPAPSTEKIETLRQSLAVLDELLAHDADAPAAPEVYAALCEALEASGRLLIPLYTFMDIRVGHEEALAEIRELSRNIERIARAHPAVRKPYWETPHTSKDIRTYQLFVHDPNLVKLTALYTGLFHETPEEAIKVYRDLMSAKAYPFLRYLFINPNQSAPLLCGWKWADRKRHVAVWDAFVGELISSTNLVTHLEGRMLEIRLQTDWKKYREKYERLMEDVSAHWSELEPRNEELNLDSVTRLYFPASNEPKASEEFSIKIYQWAADQGINRGVNYNGRLISPRKGLPTAAKREFPKLPPPSPIRRGEVLALRTYFEAAHYAETNTTEFLGPVFREGSLWARMDSETASVIVAIDVATKKTRRIPLTFAPGKRYMHPDLTDYLHLPKTFEVRSNELLVAEGAVLHRLDLRGGGKWRSQPLPEPGADVYLANGRIYLTTEQSIYELDEAGGARALASSRRRPAATALDQFDALNFAPIVAGPGNSLRAFVQGNLYSWSGSDWKQETELGNLTCIPSDAGAFLATVGFPPLVQLRGFNAREANGRFIAGAIVVSNPASTMDGQTNEWLLEYHSILHGAPAFVGATPVLYLQRSLGDPENKTAASLLAFTKGASSLTEIPLRFQGAHATELASAFNRGMRRPWLLDCPAGLLIGHNLLTGFWLIPRAEIDSATSNVILP